jgi:hypothetical protein
MRTIDRPPAVHRVTLGDPRERLAAIGIDSIDPDHRQKSF